MRTGKNQNGFSMVEVMVAATIFILTSAGVLATVAAVNQAVTLKWERQAKAAACGQQVLQGLRSQVDAGTWNSGNLQLTGGVPVASSCTDPDTGQVYSASYLVTQDVSGARQVNMTVIWANP